MGDVVLVTGGAGFIGSHLTEVLLERGARVIVLDDLSTGRSSNLDAVLQHPACELVVGSVLDAPLVERLVAEADVIVHLAAAVGVKLVLQRRLDSLRTNIYGTTNVLEAAARHGGRVMLASTSEVYGKNPASPLHEASDVVVGPPTIARWSYALAKSVDEVLANACFEELGVSTVVVRLFNTVGPRQSPSYGMVLPNLIRQALRGEALTVYGDGMQTRCFCHVQDTVDALVRLLDAPSAIGDTFNVGSSDEISIADLARKVIERTGSRSTVELVPYDRAYGRGFEDMRRRVPDTSKILARTGWRPRRTLDDILMDMMLQAQAASVG
jgi:UDP-glucose 4-epimerase